MTLYLLLGILLLGAIVPSLTAALSPARTLRFLFVLGIYPVFGAIALRYGAGEAGLWWLAMAGLTAILEFAADRLVPLQQRSSPLTTAWRAALLWPLLLPAATEALLIHAGFARPTPVATLPDPPRGEELFRLSDDDLLMAAHQILAGQSELSEAETTLWLAETFSREVHGGGVAQWFSNTDNSKPETIQALRDVGANETAELLQHEQGATPASRAIDDRLFSIFAREDLTTLIARFVRRNRMHCPALEGPSSQKETP